MLNETRLWCSACKEVWYCTKECQREHWPNHKLKCISFVKKTELAKAMLSFCKNTVYGGERALYRVLPTKTSLLHPYHHDNILLLPLVSYFNDAYVGLVLRNEPYFCQHFDAMHAILNHSHVCLLNIVFTISMGLKRAVNRPNLDISSLDAYAASVDNQLTTQLLQLEPTVVALISHQCHGQDIKLCDATKPMFHIHPITQ
jgi:hypothetical protein